MPQSIFINNKIASKFFILPVESYSTRKKLPVMNFAKFGPCFRLAKIKLEAYRIVLKQVFLFQTQFSLFCLARLVAILIN